MAFSATESAMEGFRIARHKPGTLVVWGFYLILMVVVVAIAFVAVAGPGLATYAGQAAQSPTLDPATTLARMAPIFGGFAVAIPILIVMGAVLAAAVYRSVLKPDQKGFAYLRLGGDELRLILVSIVLALVIGIPYYAAFFGVAFVSRLVGGDHPSPLVSILGILIVFCVYIWVRTRLSLALAMTVGEGKMRIFNSWGLTKGRFWSMFGMYLLVVVFAIATFIVMYIVIFIVALVGFGGMAAIGNMGHPNGASLAAAAPLAIVAGIVIFLIYLTGLTLISTLIYAAQARAYRDLSGSGQAEAF